ncbi:helix-turn-helix transcriptional regulator [Clostridium botulinum]|nr:helix-turn-helix transcriptional regulator [Clostridium botulinum]
MKITIDTVLEKQSKTRYWLAQQTGITYPSIMKFANNKSTSITFDNLQKICLALKCTPNDILKID